MIPKPEEICGGCPLYEPPYGKKYGFSVPVGTGKNGVMIVAEALGESEEKEGMPLVGKSGYTFFQQLARVGVERDDFTIYNTINCRPPDNKLVKTPYEREAIEHCSPILDAAIEVAKRVAKENGKTFTIVTLGVTAFKRIMGLDYKKDAEFLKRDYIAYPHWNDRYGCWVMATHHPAFLLRGKTNLWPIVQFVVKRALEVAENGLVLDNPDYLLDPDPSIFEGWVEGYKRSLVDNPDNPLSYDIETPYKKKKDEEEVGKEEDADHTILRISFAYSHDGAIYTVSVKWSAEFMAGIECLFATANYILGWNSTNYDYPRVSRHLKIKGIDLDGMVAWHILNTSLPKGLGFVTPFYVQNTGMWKHLSESQPAYYNAKDADMALRNYLKIKEDLVTNKLWEVFQRHVIEINKVLKYMTGIGVRLDLEMRQEAETKLQTILDGVEAKMDEAVPQEARKFKVAKKQPKELEGWQESTKEFPTDVCTLCGLWKPARWKKHSILCSGEVGSYLLPQPVWLKPLEFKISKVGMTSYQKSLRHMAIISREKKVTFNADAITMLVKKYPKDRLYPLILEHRKIQKLLSTYVGVTEYVKVEVPDDYELQQGEKWANAV